METEHCVNSRPPTYVTADPTLDEALTPNHFLLGSSSDELRFGRYEAGKTCSRKHWDIAQHHADIIWRRWLR